MARLDPRLFDENRQLVMRRFATLHAHDLNAGAPITIVDEVDEDSGPGEVSKDTAIRLWLSQMAVYSTELHPTPIESPQEYAARVVKTDPLAGGWYMIRAPWLREGVKVQGKAKADDAAAAIIARGDTKGVTVDGGDGGWYEVKAPWADEPEKVQGQDNATARADELIAEGPPAGWRQLTDEELAAQKAEKEADAKRIAENDKALEDARQEAERVAQEGREADQKAIAEAKAREFAIAPDSEDGWFNISGPGLEQPLKIEGEEAANAKVAELSAAAGAAPGSDAQEG